MPAFWCRMSMAASPVGSCTPRTSHRPSACGFASEVCSARVSADAPLHAFVWIAAEPIIIALSRVRIGLDLGMEQIRPALRSRDRSRRGRRRGSMRHVAPVVAVMTGRGALSRPGRRHGEHGAHRDRQTSIAPHEGLLRLRDKIRSAHCPLSTRKYRTGRQPVNREGA